MSVTNVCDRLAVINEYVCCLRICVAFFRREKPIAIRQRWREEAVYSGLRSDSRPWAREVF